MFQKIKKIIDELIQINNLKTQNNVRNSKVKICPSCTSKLEPLNGENSPQLDDEHYARLLESIKKHL